MAKAERERASAQKRDAVLHLRTGLRKVEPRGHVEVGESGAAQSIKRRRKAGRSVVPTKRFGGSADATAAGESRRLARKAGAPVVPARDGRAGVPAPVLPSFVFTWRKRDLRTATPEERLETLRALRMVRDLLEEGTPTAVIVQLSGLEPDVVGRLVRRRAVLPGAVTAEEVILQRHAGEISDERMLERLQAMRFTYSPPPAEGRFDDSSPGTGSAKQLLRAFQDGLLSQDEYTVLSRTVEVGPVRP